MTDTDSAQQLAWPSAWRESRRKAVVQTMLLGFVGMVGVLLGAAHLDSDLVEGLLLVAASLMFGLFSALHYVTRLRRVRGSGQIYSIYLDHAGEQAVVASYSRGPFLVALSLWGQWFLFSAVLFALGITRGVEREFGSVELVMVVVGIALMVPTALFLTEVALGRLKRGYVALAPSGVHYRSWAIEGFFPWEESTGVRAIQMEEPVIVLSFPSNESVRIRSHSRVWRNLRYAPNLVVRPRWLTVDPVLMLATMEFYQRNPGKRSELGSQSAVERIAQHQLV